MVSVAAQLGWRRFANFFLLAGAVVFALQTAFVAMSEAATGDTSHYYQGFALRHAFGDAATQSHVMTHVHADGTIHRHAVDDGDLDDHIKKRGWNMAIVVGVLPCRTHFDFATIVCGTLDARMPDSLQLVDPDEPTKPPRPPSIT
jgi:ABC-type nickel/cobalt efflux system permease component RcnA